MFPNSNYNLPALLTDCSPITISLPLTSDGRLSNTLLHVPNLHWLLVEDADHKSDLVSRLLRRSGLVYTHLNVATPPEMKLQPKVRPQPAGVWIGSWI